MNSLKRDGRIAGLLFLFNFIAGVTVYQILQGSVLISEDFLTLAAEHSNDLILSVLLGMASGIASVSISVILFPIFKKHRLQLAVLYVAFCVIYFGAVMIDNFGVLALLEVSKEYVKSGQASALLPIGEIFSEAHWWTHYLSLITSCLPAFVLYLTLFVSKLIPRAISVFGLFAVVLMLVELLSSIFGQSLSMNLMLPMGLVQLTLILWLLIKSFKEMD